jgi:uncharacterized protein YqeY
MEELIQRDIMSAMKEKDEVKLAALRAVKTAIMQTKTSSTFKGDRGSVLPDGDVVKIMQKLVKEREESAEIYANANRKELADNEINEANIIKAYLPKPLSNDEVESMVKEAIEETNAASMKDMGKVIALVNSKANGRTDGKTISVIVKKILSV